MRAGAPSAELQCREIGGALGFLRHRGLQLFDSGLALLYLVERASVATGNPTFVPSGKNSRVFDTACAVKKTVRQYIILAADPGRQSK